MENIGFYKVLTGCIKMLLFCGQDRCHMDANGRLKLSPRVISDFQRECDGEIVMHCLPEGAVAVYPEKIFLEMRAHSGNPAARIGNSMLQRRELRRYGALSTSGKISEQGRLTLPQGFRDYGALQPGDDILVVGVEVGVELWNAERWEAELAKMDEHAMAKGESEMVGDLINKE